MDLILSCDEERMSKRYNANTSLPNPAYLSHLLCKLYHCFDSPAWNSSRVLRYFSTASLCFGANFSSDVKNSSQRKSLLEKHGNALYKGSIFSPEEYTIIRQELSHCMEYLQEESKSSIAQNRLGTTIAPDSGIIQILKTGSLHRLVEKVTGEVYELSPDLPVEVRSYEREGAGMSWHVDDVLYYPPQIEVIWTLENDSDCVTMWKETNTDRMRTIETEPNSVVLLLAGGASHCVTHLKRGKRIILKCAYAKKGSSYLSGLHQNQFEGNKRRRRKKKRR